MERARIVFAIENEMSADERSSETNRYWTNIDGERYLQVEEVDDQSFLHDDNEEEEEDDEKKGEQKKSHDSEVSKL